MRISSSLFFQTGLNSINAQQADLLHLYRQAASGQRMVTPADDPLAAAQAVNLSQSQSLNERYAANRDVLKMNLGHEENTLNSITTLLQDIKTRLVEAGNGTMSDADRATLADVLKNSKETLFGLANATDGNGQYLFSGFSASQPAFIKDALGSVSYSGDTGQREIQADQTRRIQTGDLGIDVFARAANGSRAYITQADPANSGTGVIGSPSITDPQGAHVGKPFEIEFTEAAGVLQYTVRAFHADGSVAEADGPHDYDSGTAILSLPGGVQVAFSGSPSINDKFTVHPASVPAYQGMAAKLNVFDTLDNIIAALVTPTSGDATAQARIANALASAMQKIDVNYDQVLTVRASVGSRLAEIDAIDAAGSSRSLSYANQLSKLEDVDYYTVTTQLELRRSALEAAALAFKKIQGTSLFNMGS